jgi:hypothetical protein
VLYRPSDAIGSPDQHDVKTTAAGIAQHGIESWTPGFGSTDPVRILLNDLIAALLGHLAKVVELGLRVLIERGDTQIEGGALHRGSLSITYISEICKKSEIERLISTKQEVRTFTEFIGLPGFIMKSVFNSFYPDKSKGKDVYLQGSRQMDSLSRQYYERNLGAGSDSHDPD